MSKEYLNTLSMDEIKERLCKGEKIFNETDETSYAKYVPSIGICKFLKKTDTLLAMNLTLTLFYHLYFENDDYKDMIGCVGWFWDDKIENRMLGILRKYCCGDGFAFYNEDNCFKNFRPAKKSELKFWEDEEQAPYNYIVENIELKEQLKEAEKVLLEVMDCREDREFYRDLADEYFTKRSKTR